MPSPAAAAAATAAAAASAALQRLALLRNKAQPCRSSALLPACHHHHHHLPMTPPAPATGCSSSWGGLQASPSTPSGDCVGAAHASGSGSSSGGALIRRWPALVAHGVPFPLWAGAAHFARKRGCVGACESVNAPLALRYRTSTCTAPPCCTVCAHTQAHCRRTPPSATTSTLRRPAAWPGSPRSGSTGRNRHPPPTTSQPSTSSWTARWQPCAPPL